MWRRQGTFPPCCRAHRQLRPPRLCPPGRPYSHQWLAPGPGRPASQARRPRLIPASDQGKIPIPRPQRRLPQSLKPRRTSLRRWAWSNHRTSGQGFGLLPGVPCADRMSPRHWPRPAPLSGPVRQAGQGRPPVPPGHRLRQARLRLLHWPLPQRHPGPQVLPGNRRRPAPCHRAACPCPPHQGLA